MSDRLVTYLSEEEIRGLNQELGKKISATYQSLLEPNEELLIIVTLKGAIFFAADLARELTIPTTIDFVRVASYGAGTKSTGTVRILKDVESTLEGQHVLILDEIVDSGRTLQFLIERVKASNPKTLKVCSLLSKPSRREVPVHVDFLGREVEDKFLVGYGLDYAEKYRSLKQISYLDGR